MKKKTKRYLATILATATAAATLLSGCGGDGGSGTKGGSAKGGLPELTADRYELDATKPAWQLDKKTETTELTWYVNADWWNTDWGNDTVTKKIKEDLNLDVQFITGDDTKLNTFFAGGKKPDIITIFDANSSVAQSAANWAWSLNDLADKYDPYFYEVASKDSFNWFKLSDGKTYGYPDYSNGQDVYDSGLLKATTAFAIRKDVYEALGKPVMGTPEQFISVLKEIKEKYPDLTLSQAYREGLISDDNFSDDGTAHEDKVKTGKYACLFIGGTPQRSGPLQVWRSANPDAEYIAIDGPQSTVGNAPTLSQAGLSGWMVNYISKDCSDPIKAMETFTYLISDYGGLLCKYGVEGETYTINSDGLYELTPEVKEMKDNDNDKFKHVYRLSEFIVFGNDKYDAYSADVTESTVQMQEWGAGKLKPQFVIENISPDQGSAEARALSAINTNWNTTLTSLIRSADDAAFDAVLAEHVAFRESNNWDGIVKIYNEKMSANREKLGQ